MRDSDIRLVTTVPGGFRPPNTSVAFPIQPIRIYRNNHKKTQHERQSFLYTEFENQSKWNYF